MEVLDFVVVDGADAAPDPPHAVRASPTPRATPIARNLELITFGLLPSEAARSGPATVRQKRRGVALAVRKHHQPLTVRPATRSRRLETPCQQVHRGLTGTVCGC